MPALLTNRFKNEELYFDTRPGGVGEPEGFWAVPMFYSEKRRIIREAVAKGREETYWIDMLKESVRNWQGFRDLEGNEIACTPETIGELCESDPAAMLAILAKITDAARQGRRNAEKN